MRDAAAAAAMSDPEQNRWFRRRWAEYEIAERRFEPVVHGPPQDFEVIGRELLAAWRRERADWGAGR